MSSSGDSRAEVQVGEELRPRAVVRLGVKDVGVELCRCGGEIAAGHALPMQLVEASGDGYAYEAVEVRLTDSGLYGYTARVRPKHSDLPQLFLAGCVAWAGE